MESDIIILIVSLQEVKGTRGSMVEGVISKTMSTGFDFRTCAPFLENGKI